MDLIPIPVIHLCSRELQTALRGFTFLRLIEQSQFLKRLTKARQTKANTQHTEIKSISITNSGVIGTNSQVCLCN